MRTIDIRIKLAAIVAVSVLVFWAGSLYLSLCLFAAMLFVWLVSGLGFKDLKQVGKIKWFVLAIVFFHSYFSFERDLLLFTFFRWAFMISKAGFLQGLLMGSNVLVMLLITTLVRRTSTPEEVVKGLQGFGMGMDQATVLDAVMELVDLRKEKKKKRQDRNDNPDKGDKGLLGRIMGKVASLMESVNGQLRDAKLRFQDSYIAIVVTFTTAISAIRFIKIAPGLPVAPGHKNLLIMPLFINAVKLSDRRFTAANIGLLSGLINLLAGFGKYGPFGPLQFMVPGLVIDLMSPLFKKSRSLIIFGFVGLIAGAGRVAAEIALAYLVGMPQEFYLVYLPFIVSQCAFGMLSAPVTVFLSNNLESV